MSAVLHGIPTQATASPGLWHLAGRRLLADRVGMVSAAVVLLFLLTVFAAALGLVAKDWGREVGVSYANPGFLAGRENLEADAVREAKKKVQVPPVDLSAVDPLAPRYKEWEERTERIKITEVERSETLPFGGDKWGRDVIKKTIKGAQVSILVGLFAAACAVLLGTLFGALAGYFGGWINDVLEWVYNVFTSIPYILLVLACAAVAAANPLIGKGVATVILVLAVTGWTGIYRLIRAEYIKHRSREYVRAAEAIGASDGRRMFKHILPNVSHVILVQLSQHVVQFIKAEVILSFLGFGVPVDMVSWGTMLSEAQNELVIGKWWQLVAAGASMAVLVTAFSMFTDALRDALDPKLK
jgi:peptide/nickel transport system permease protein